MELSKLGKSDITYNGIGYHRKKLVSDVKKNIRRIMVKEKIELLDDAVGFSNVSLINLLKLLSSEKRKKIQDTLVNKTCMLCI